MDAFKNYLQNVENKKLLLGVGVFIFILIILFAFFSYRNFSSESTQTTSNTDPNGPDEEYTREQKQLEDQFLEEDQESSRISQLIDNLPYKGANFSLSYDYSSLQFTLTLLQGKELEGTQEYEDFMRVNGINIDLVNQDLIKITSPNL